MRKRIALGSGLILLAFLLTLLIWQGSFTFGPYAPSSLEQTYLFWALSTLIFILIVMLGFMLFRTAVKLYIERQTHRVGSHIKGKLVAGALALTFLPVFFLVLWSVYVLNYNLDKWFSRPGQNIRSSLVDVAKMIDGEMRDKLTAQAHWMSLLVSANELGAAPESYERFCRENRIDFAALEPASSGSKQVLCGRESAGFDYTVRVNTMAGTLTLAERLPLDLGAVRSAIDRSLRDYNRLAADKTSFRKLYLLLLSAITLFVLFFATWIARYLAAQISTPITALLDASQQVRKGNLAYRVEVAAIDELATLVKAFNEMTAELETNAKELEARRRFTEAILESIPTGVISLAPDGRILRVNRALLAILPEERISGAAHLNDIFPREDVREILYLMNRARRTGVAGSQTEFQAGQRVLHLAITVAALNPGHSSGFVLVVEDTSELLRAQKSDAWNEVARRVAHEIKNPLTPIALCAERIARRLDRGPLSADATRIVRECSQTILREVDSVKMLVDEFSQFTRFPEAHPVPSSLNQVVAAALAVFDGRLDGIEVQRDLAPGLPEVNIDPEQFKRVIVNLVDNAAEAMQESLMRELYVGTGLANDDAVQLVIADTGCGISPEDKEKLFLPYFSTKGRGTGLGLAIVNRILADHSALIRVEDNLPTGARFIIDIPIVERQTAQVPSAAGAPA